MGSVARKPPPPRAGAGADPVDGVLVRRAASNGWLRGLPPCPHPSAVTVSLTNPTAAIRHAAELAAHGYRPVGAAGCANAEADWAHFLVPRNLACSEVVWLRALAGPEGRVYEPAMGPVRSLLGAVLDAHHR